MDDRELREDGWRRGQGDLERIDAHPTIPEGLVHNKLQSGRVLPAWFPGDGISSSAREDRAQLAPEPVPQPTACMSSTRFRGMGDEGAEPGEAGAGTAATGKSGLPRRGPVHSNQIAM